MRINSATDAAQLLLDRGVAPDIFLAATLGDLSLVSRIIESNPNSVTYHIVNNSGSFADIGFQGKGRTIYLPYWTLDYKCYSSVSQKLEDKEKNDSRESGAS